MALDVRNIEIPGFALEVFLRPGGDTAVNVPGWRFGVAPLREIAPEPKEKGAHYLRPNPVADFVNESRPLTTFIICAATTIFLVLLVARDRAWPPFHKRRARIFSILARQFAAKARGPCNEEDFRLAMRKLHRAIDTACGHSILKGDLAEFFRGRPEFASAQAQPTASSPCRTKSSLTPRAPRLQRISPWRSSPDLPKSSPSGKGRNDPNCVRLSASPGVDALGVRPAFSFTASRIESAVDRRRAH